MRPAVVFFLAFFFLFFKDGGGVSASAHRDTDKQSITLQLSKTDHSAVTGSLTKGLPGMKQGREVEKKENIISLEEENEEHLSAPKFELLVKYIFTLANASVLLLLGHSVKNRLPFCKHFSDISSNIYILQRVLRL